jgi:hypothetical protein
MLKGDMQWCRAVGLQQASWHSGWPPPLMPGPSSHPLEVSSCTPNPSTPSNKHPFIKPIRPDTRQCTPPGADPTHQCRGRPWPPHPQILRCRWSPAPAGDSSAGDGDSREKQGWEAAGRHCMPPHASQASSGQGGECRPAFPRLSATEWQHSTYQLAGRQRRSPRHPSNPPRPGRLCSRQSVGA